MQSMVDFAIIDYVKNASKTRKYKLETSKKYTHIPIEYEIQSSASPLDV